MKAYLSIGTNIGDRLRNLQTAVDALNLLPNTAVTAVSNVYETAPVGFSDQQDFLNICVETETSLTAEGLLGACLGIEAGLGRVRVFKNGPRVIDLDLLLYGNSEINTEMLTLPHPRMLEREFVLKPLTDIDFQNPLFDRKKAEESLTGEGVRPFNGKIILEAER